MSPGAVEQGPLTGSGTEGLCWSPVGARHVSGLEVGKGPLKDDGPALDLEAATAAASAAGAAAASTAGAAAKFAAACFSARACVHASRYCPSIF
jgi:hypothetical protein